MPPRLVATLMTLLQIIGTVLTSSGASGLGLCVSGVDEVEMGWRTSPVAPTAGLRVTMSARRALSTLVFIMVPLFLAFSEALSEKLVHVWVVVSRRGSNMGLAGQ